MSTKKTSVNPFDVSRDELLNLAAQKLVDELGDTSALWDEAKSLLHKKVEELVNKDLKIKIDDFLNLELHRITNELVQPVDIWGGQVGKPTTIRQQLSDRAKNFWMTSVNHEGRETTYGGTERYKMVLQQITKEEFEKIVKAHAETIVAAFKVALIADSQKLVAEHINKLIR